MSRCENDVLEKNRVSQDLQILFAWVQEHANLCTVSALCPRTDSETRERLRKGLSESLERGTHLLECTMTGSEVVSHASSGLREGSLPVVVSSRSVMPLSGSQRFDEGMVGRVRVVKPQGVIDCSPAELQPSRTYTKGKAEPKKVS